MCGICFFDEENDFVCLKRCSSDFIRKTVSNPSNHFKIWHGVETIDDVPQEIAEKIKQINNLFQLGSIGDYANNSVQNSSNLNEYLENFSSYDYKPSSDLAQLPIKVSNKILLNKSNYIFSSSLDDNFEIDNIVFNNGLTSEHINLLEKLNLSLNKTSSLTFNRKFESQSTIGHGIYSYIIKSVARKYLIKKYNKKNKKNEWFLDFDVFRRSGMYHYSGK